MTNAIKFSLAQIVVTGAANTSPKWAVVAKKENEVRCYSVSEHGAHFASAVLQTITCDTARGCDFDFFAYPLVQTRTSKKSGKTVKFLA
jgi:hypothetical protein